MVLTGGGRIRAAFGQQEVRKRFDFGVSDGGADGAAALAFLFHQSGGGQQFQVMGQRRTGDIGAFPQCANAQAIGASPHKAAQNGQALFGPKGRKAGGSKGKGRGVG